MNKKAAIDWKSRADDLAHQLQEAQLVTEGLEKQVRLERERAKHFKEVAKFETSRCKFLAKELHRLKLDLSSINNRMNLLDEYFSRDGEDTADLAKTTGCSKLQTQQSQKKRKNLEKEEILVLDRQGGSSANGISIAVLKSIVMFLESGHFSTVERNAKLHSGNDKCPSSDMSSSLEVMASMLMGILQEFTQSNNLHQSLTGSLGSTHLEKTEFRPAHKDFQCLLTRDQSVNICDILLLVELITCYTAWDWTSANIVSPLLKMLGMPYPMNFSVAIVSLLGNLSKQYYNIGVDARGYENEGISIMREKLSAYLQCETTLKAGFAVQIATVSSLLKTLQLKFPIDFQGKTTMLPGSDNQSLSGSVNLVIKWLSLLSDEQRVFATEFLQISVGK